MRIRRAEEVTEATKEAKATEATKATARGFRRSRLGLLIPLGLFADLVYVYEQSLAGGVASQMSDRTLETGGTYSTASAPAKSGYIFTHWSISAAQSITNRDRLGRAKEVASFTLYEETTLTANYLAEGEDSDNDGIADGWEIYWYGDLSKSASSDTDGDDFTFAEELAAGTDPLMSDESLPGGIVWQDGALVQYNPDNLQAYVVRSEPEGALFATRSDYLKLGTAIPIPSVSGNFAYWTIDGVRQFRANAKLRVETVERVLKLSIPPADGNPHSRIYAFDVIVTGDDPKKRLLKSVYAAGANMGIGHAPNGSMTIFKIPVAELPKGAKLKVAVRPITSLGTHGRAITWSS